MLKTGTGLIAANLVVLYGLVLGQTGQGLPRLARGTIKLHSLNQSDTERGPRHSDGRKMWDDSSGPAASFVEFRPEPPNDENIVELNDILIIRTLQRTEETSEILGQNIELRLSLQYCEGIVSFPK